MKSAAAIAFEIRPSRLFCGALAGLTLLALIAVWLSGLRAWPWAAAALSLALIVAGLRAVRRQQRPGWRRVVWTGQGQWRLLDTGDVVSGAVLLSWRALGPLLLLRLQPERGAALLLALLGDNLDADTHRRLRVRLAQESAAPPTLPDAS